MELSKSVPFCISQRYGELFLIETSKIFSFININLNEKIIRSTECSKSEETDH